MMSKELEALERIKKLLEDKYGLLIYVDDFDIIEKALKKLEQAENCVFTSKEDVKKEHQALEIIKEKEANVGYLKYHFEKGNGGYREYKRVMNTSCLDYYPTSKMLTKEDYDLLKEVLL